jgi:hypothetical protein
VTRLLGLALLVECHLAHGFAELVDVVLSEDLLPAPAFDEEDGVDVGDFRVVIMLGTNQSDLPFPTQGSRMKSLRKLSPLPGARSRWEKG